MCCDFLAEMQPGSGIELFDVWREINGPGPYNSMVRDMHHYELTGSIFGPPLVLTDRLIDLLDNDTWHGHVPGWWRGYAEEKERMHVLKHAIRFPAARRWSWAVPTEEALQAIVDLGRPIVDPQAGTGYWAMFLAERGADVVAFDRDPPVGAGG